MTTVSGCPVRKRCASAIVVEDALGEYPRDSVLDKKILVYNLYINRMLVFNDCFQVWIRNYRAKSSKFVVSENVSPPASENRSEPVRLIPLAPIHPAHPSNYAPTVAKDMLITRGMATDRVNINSVMKEAHKVLKSSPAQLEKANKWAASHNAAKKVTPKAFAKKFLKFSDDALKALAETGGSGFAVGVCNGKTYFISPGKHAKFARSFMKTRKFNLR